MILEDLASVIEPIEIHFQWRPQLPDPDDELVLEAAINGRADIVTYNVKDFANVESLFNVRVRKPAEMLKELDQ